MTDYFLKKVTAQPGPVRSVPVSFGCDPSFLHKEIVNLPPNAVRVRRRLRAHSAMQVFVSFSDGSVVHYIAGPDGPFGLKLLWPIGGNKKEVL